MGTKNIIDSGLSKSGENIGGINALNFNGTGMTEAQQWVVNQQWLDEVINRSDIIRVISNPLNKTNILGSNVNLSLFPDNAFLSSESLSNLLLNLNPTQVNQLSFFGKEVRHLFQNGFAFNLTSNQFIK